MMVGSWETGGERAEAHEPPGGGEPHESVVLLLDGGPTPLLQPSKTPGDEPKDDDDQGAEADTRNLLRKLCDGDVKLEPIKCLVFLGVFYNIFIAVGLPYSMGVIYVEFLHSFQTTKAAAAMVASTCIGMLGCGGLLGGMLVNRFGTRWTMFAGGLISASGLFVSFFATSIWFLLISLGLVVGFGNAIVNIASMVRIGEVFGKHKLIVTMFTTVARPLGVLVLPFVQSSLIREFGWRGSLLISSGIALNICVWGAFLGIQKEAARDELQQQKRRKIFDVDVFKNMKLVGFIVMTCVVNNSTVIMLIILVDYGLDQGYTHSQSVFLVPLTSITSISARLVLALLDLVPKWTHMGSYILTLIFSGSATLLIPLCKNYTSLVVDLLFYGLGNGMKSGIIPVIILEIAGVEKYSIALGLYFTINGLGSIPSGPLLGLVADVTGSYVIPIISAGAFCTCLGLCFGAAYLLRHRLRKTKEDGGEEPTETEHS